MKARMKMMLGASELRECCITNDYYTLGTGIEYERLFSLLPLDHIVTEETLVNLAEDIVAHSDLKELAITCGYSDSEVLESVLFTLSERVRTTWSVVEEEEFEMCDMEIED